MSMTDPISDMLTRIRNAQTARKPSVTMPASKQKLADRESARARGLPRVRHSRRQSTASRTLTLELKYYQDRPVIERIQRVSRPGLRILQARGRAARRAGRPRRRDRLDVAGRHDQSSSHGRRSRRRSALHRSLIKKLESPRCRE